MRRLIIFALGFFFAGAFLTAGALGASAAPGSPVPQAGPPTVTAPSDVASDPASADPSANASNGTVPTPMHSPAAVNRSAPQTEMPAPLLAPTVPAPQEVPTKIIIHTEQGEHRGLWYLVGLGIVALLGLLAIILGMRNKEGNTLEEELLKRHSHPKPESALPSAGLPTDPKMAIRAEPQGEESKPNLS